MGTVTIQHSTLGIHCALFQNGTNQIDVCYNFRLVTAYSRHFGDGCTIFEKRASCLLGPPKQTSFLTISNKSIFFKTQGTRLGAIVAPNKSLE